MYLGGTQDLPNSVNVEVGGPQSVGVQRGQSEVPGDVSQSQEQTF